MGRDAAVTAEKKASQECAAQDGHEITDIEGHDSQHAEKKKLGACCSVMYRDEERKLTVDIQCRQ